MSSYQPLTPDSELDEEWEQHHVPQWVRNKIEGISLFQWVDEVLAEGRVPEARHSRSASEIRMACCFHGGEDTNLAVGLSRRYATCWSGCGGKNYNIVSMAMSLFRKNFYDAILLLGEYIQVDVAAAIEKHKASRIQSPAELEGELRAQAIQWIYQLGQALKEREGKVPAMYDRDYLCPLPPVARLIAGLKQKGVTEATLSELGLDHALKDEAWQQGGWAAFAGYVRIPGQVSAIRPLASETAVVIGPRGVNSAGYVGMGSERPYADNQGWIALAADGYTFKCMLKAGFRGGVLPVGRLQREDLWALNGLHPIVLSASGDDHMEALYGVAREHLQGEPRLGVEVIEDATTAEGYRNNVYRAALQAGTSFDWVVSRLSLEGALESPEGRERAARQLSAWIDDMPPGPFRMACEAEMFRITGYRYPQGTREVRSRTT